MEGKYITEFLMRWLIPGAGGKHWLWKLRLCSTPDPLPSPAHVMLLVKITEQRRQQSNCLHSLALMSWEVMSLLPRRCLILRFGECEGDSGTARGRGAPTHVGVSSRSAPGSSLAWWVQGGFGSSVVMAAAAPDLWCWGGVKVWCQRHRVVAWLSCLQPVKDFLSTDLCVKSILPKVPRVVFLYWTLMIKCHYVGKK